MTETKRILGIDPGSRVTGYGIVDTDGATTRYVTSGCLRVGSGEFTERLQQIYAGIAALVGEHQPTAVAIESVFVHKNADSALKLGHARAAAICGTFGGGAVLHEYAAREIKQAVVGRGGADKEQVQHMVRAILSLDSLPVSDEADALAAAICHAHSFRVGNELLTAGSSSRRTSRSSSWRKFAG